MLTLHLSMMLRHGLGSIDHRCWARHMFPPIACRSMQMPQLTQAQANMSDLGLSRLEIEAELLDAMYPDQTSFNIKSREFAFSSGAASLVLRLPELYPESG